MDNNHDNLDLLNTTFLDGANASYLAQLQDSYEKDPNSVDPEVRAFFDGLGDAAEDVAHAANPAPWGRDDLKARGDADALADLGDFTAAEEVLAEKISERQPAASQEEIRAQVLDSIRAIMMIRAYRVRGHYKPNWTHWVWNQRANMKN
jgi:2-oxoglutarate dehydrogenase complex, dehydrogenase (E1) component, and related enzymes